MRISLPEIYFPKEKIHDKYINFHTWENTSDIDYKLSVWPL